MSRELQKEFQRLALPHLGAIHDVALRLTKSRSDAKDLTRDTYLKAFASFGSFEPGSSVRAWLFTILRNAARNLRRDCVGRSSEPLDDDGLPAAQSHDEVPDWARLTPDSLDELIALLPIHLREAVVLRDLEGLSYREVAAVLSCPVGTVMSRLNRGRAALRRMALDRLGPSESRSAP